MSFFTEPLAFEFMRQALIMAAIVAAPCSLLSCYLVLKGWALMGDAVSHSVLPGVVLAYITGVPLLIGAFAAGLFCALATGFVTDNSRVKQDTVMGVVFSGMFGMGLVLYTSIETAVHLDHILFGDILGVTWGDITQTGIIAALVTFGLMIWRKDLLVHAFDPNHASALGFRTGWLHYGLLVALSLTIVATLKAAGLILAIAFLIAPGAVAFLMTRTFRAMMLVALLVSTSSSVLGVLWAFHIDSAPAPTIVVVMTTAFVLAFLFAPQRGLLRRTGPSESAGQ
ncbi:MAG: metal ABC transporter permease [Pseudomonadota bacterium]